MLEDDNTHPTLTVALTVEYPKQVTKENLLSDVKKIII